MAQGWHTQEPASTKGIALDGKAYLKPYYAGRRMESPMGGILHVLRIRPEPDGSGTVLFECSASSLRYELRVPKATRTEKSKVKAQQEEGLDPVSPRFADPVVKLVRTGEHLVCPKCGVRFGKVG